MALNYKKETLNFIEKLITEDKKFFYDVKKLIEKIEKINLNENKKVTKKDIDTKPYLMIDILDKVITNKELLRQELSELKISELRQIIKKYNFNENPNISKLDNRFEILEYILSEAERRMKGYSIL